MSAAGVRGDRTPGAEGDPRPSGPVYAIADAEMLDAAARPIPEAVAAMARAGAGWIQLRAKRLDDVRLYELARACRRALDGTAARLWIDDRPDVAALVGADGVHVG